jgi:hypothetical protein
VLEITRSSDEKKRRVDEVREFNKEFENDVDRKGKKSP